MEYSSRFRSYHRGFTMVELMVTLAIGLVIVGLVGGIYLGSKKSSRYQETTSRLQENARFANDNLSRAIRNAGYSGCRTDIPTANVVVGGAASWWLNLSAPIIGYEGGVSAFPAGITTTGTAAGVLIADTDAFTTVGLDSSNELSVIGHNPTSAQIDTTQHKIKPGAILVISDCSRAAIFQVSGPTNNNGNATNVVHNTGASTDPGNCYKGLGTSCSGTQTNYQFKPGSTLMQMTASAFYIGKSTSTTGNGRSLWTIQLGNDPSNGNVVTTPVELIEGVDDMQIEYGESATVNGAPDRYVKANEVTSWPKVVSMRVSLLMSTLEDNVSTGKQTYTYNGTSTTASDRRVRRVYTSVYNLRNRSL